MMFMLTGEFDDGNGRTLRSPCHSTQVLGSLANMRKNESLCDITLVAEEKAFHAHKVVLASSSEYFEVMFSSGMRESKDSEIKIGNISSEMLSTLLDFIYTGQLTVHLDTVDELLHASSMLLFLKIRKECLNFLDEKLNISNCVKVKHLAEVYDDRDLATKANKFILQNFEEIVESDIDDLINLTFEEFNDLLCNDEIFCKTEDFVIKALFKWLEKNTAEDKDDVSSLFDKLISNVRLPFISQKIMDDNIAITLKEKFPGHNEKMLAILVGVQKKQLKATRKKQIKPRVSQKHVPMLLCVNKQGETVCFDNKDKKFTKFTRFPIGYQPEKLMSEDGIVYALATTSSVESGTFVTSRALFQFDSSNSFNWKLKQVTNDKLTCESFSATFLQGKLYVVGGRMTGIPQNSDNSDVEKMLKVYDPKKGKWKIKSPTKEKRIESTLIAAERNLFVIGGRNTEFSPFSRRAVNTVEKYCPKSDSWELLPPMKNYRLAAFAVFYNDKLFVFGGSHETFPIRGIEIYCQRRKEWNPVSVLPDILQTVTSAFVLGDKILVLGEATWGGEYVIQYSPEERHKKLNGDVLSSFFHIGHHPDYFMYGVLKIPVYDQKNGLEWTCDCKSYNDSDLSVPTSGGSIFADSDSDSIDMFPLWW